MKKSEQKAAVERLIDTFGATVLVDAQPVPTLKRSYRAMLRDAAMDRAWDCTSCSLHRTCRRRDEKGPTFPKAGLVSSCDLIVVTLHPAAEGSRYHSMIRHALSNADIDADRVSFVPVVACVPRTEDGSLRPPTATERKACEANLYAALEAANCPYVLIVGQPAMKAWRDLRLEQMRGQVGLWRNVWNVAVVEHPAVPQHEGKAAIKQWYATVAGAVQMLHGGMLDGLGHTCTHLKCSEEAFAWDADALPWCRRHLEVKNTKRPRDYTDHELPLETGT